jgi:thiamine-phosphate pyrophosphorylase
MQKKIPKVYLFIEDFIPSELNRLDKNISIIFRNYKKTINDSKIFALKNYCKFHKRDLYLANDIKRAIKYKLNGVYIPSFNKKLNLNAFSLHKNFMLLGSAHNQLEIKVKETQGCSLIFLAPTFKVNKKKNYFGITKFNLLTLNQKSEFIALGGINEFTIKKVGLLRCVGYSGISWIKKNGLKNIRPFLNNLSTN